MTSGIPRSWVLTLLRRVESHVLPRRALVRAGANDREQLLNQGNVFALNNCAIKSENNRKFIAMAIYCMGSLSLWRRRVQARAFPLRASRHFESARMSIIDAARPWTEWNCAVHASSSVIDKTLTHPLDGDEVKRKLGYKSILQRFNTASRLTYLYES